MTQNVSASFLRPDSPMASRILEFDWSTTPLGPIDSWPSVLKVAVGMMIHSNFPKCVVWGPELVTIYNDAFKPILGNKPEALGRSFRDVWHEVWESLEAIVARAYRGESTFIEDFPLIINRYGYPERCNFTFCYSPIPDENGTVVGFLDTVIETTGKVEAERAATVRNQELAHRIRNTLSLVAAIAGQTLKSSNTIEGARQTFLHRLQALANAHGLLTSSAKPSAMISEVVAKAVEPHATSDEHFRVSGPAIQLPERQALSLALAVNELATNAAKHGALSVPSGRVLISWSITQDSTNGRVLQFNWSEEGGPPCAPPGTKSFGTRLLESVVPADFSGEARLTFEPEGFRYTLIGNIERFPGS